MLNVVAIQGRLVADPTVRITTTGKKVASFRLACDRGLVDWLDVVAWEQRAGFAEQYLGKGQLVAVNGRLQSRSYQDKTGANRQAVEIVADGIHFCGPKAQAAPAVDEGGYAGPAGQQAPADDSYTLIEGEGDLPF
ncbi:MAG TPA: single-stranded DNA-binding protein [Candidatus Gemmiger avicola]|uniref:Single-stranded DNA-binding protein n=1 Tax=Candidatus Gemmiger avicola TaxID=2838605 RepID=A0A9D2M959_9FIRM|nr:single-stranded DNA-binding protein [Candidatus Gemmiger avicola]